MKTLDIIFTLISWVGWVFFIGFVGAFIESELFVWFACIIVGLIYGRYLDKTFNEGDKK